MNEYNHAMQIETAKQQSDEWNPLLKRAAWYAFKLFAILRIGTLAWMVLLFFLGGRVITEPNVLCRSSDLLESNLNIGGALGAWLRWDTVCYLLIAETGYTVHAGLTVWPPIYPLLIRLFSFIAAPPILAALIISSITTWLAFLLLYIFITEDHDETTARNTVALYTIYPLSFFLVAGYTESLFLALVVGSLLLARKKEWIAAGLLAALATLTRNQGIVLSFVLFWEAILQYRTQHNTKPADILKMLTASALPAIAFGAFALYVHEGLHADWPWQTLAGIWGQYTGWPWEGIIGNVKQLLTLPVSKDLYWLPTNILDLFLAVTIPIVLIVHRRSIRSSYMLFAGLILLLGLIKVGPDHTLVSFSRYVIPVFPFFIASSPVVQNRFSRLAVLTICLILQIIFLTMFYVWSWAG
jgi:Gpi18-like mannosyltransferase